MKKSTLVLLAVAGGLVLCCGGSTLAVMVLGLAGADGPTRGSGGPAPLVGQWMYGSVSMVEYRSVLTGEFAPPSGQGQSYDLRDDGRCVQAAMMQVSTGIACTSFIFTYTGDDGCSWSVDGNTLTIELAEGTLRSRICSGEVKEGASKPRTIKAPYRIEREGQLTWLVLDEEGAEFRYRRAQ